MTVEMKITTHDRLLRAWGNSMAIVRNFETYAKEIEYDKKTAEVFARFAEDEGQHTSWLREILHHTSTQAEKQEPAAS